MSEEHNYLTDCLTSVVSNPTTRDRDYPFLPPHGLHLAAGATHRFKGDIVAQIGAGLGQVNHRKLLGFLASVRAGRLKILSRPAPLMIDNHGNSYMVDVVDGVVVPTSPCWATDNDSESLGAL